MSEGKSEGSSEFGGNRRRFISTMAAGWAAALGLSHLSGRVSRGESVSGPGYGPLAPVRDEATGWELLRLPEGFRYVSFGWTGDPLDGPSGDGDERLRRTPPLHDGMGVIKSGADGRLILCRNHEVSGDGLPFGVCGQSYDPRGPAGCVNLEFDGKQGRWLRSWCSLSGTSRNCAGGVTPWGAWLSCEETVYGPETEIDEYQKTPLHFERTHGWVFEVPSGEASAPPRPLKALGRFVHEAVAVDPYSGIVYLTEDRKTSGFYRFTPRTPGQLGAGGLLQMLRAPSAPDLRKGVELGRRFAVEWVNIDDPERAHSPGTTDELGVYHQGKSQGAATFARLEGCWHSVEDGKIYFDATTGGDKEAGQIWAFDPKEQTLQLIFESPGKEVLDMPDNLCVSPQGNVVLCEDGDANPHRLHGLTTRGQLFTLAENNVVLKEGQKPGVADGDYRAEEWCGACFSPDGEWLFVNIQTPGITFAITGPWNRGAL